MSEGPLVRVSHLRWLELGSSVGADERRKWYAWALSLLILVILLASAMAAGAGVASAEIQVYIVQRGDTLAKIAARNNTTVAALLASNGLSNPNFIWVGQKLKVGQVAVTPAPLPTQTPAPAPQPASEGRWIDVNLTQQRLTAYEGQTSVFTTLVSTGLPRYPTVVGRYKIRDKVRLQAMSGPGYYLPNVPYVMHFYGSYALHGTYWHKNFGHPMSHGCVNLATPDAAWLFNWASIGTPVVTHY